ncbi:hypothetical protein LTR08_003089 [Meristemomyces frigidus]|nr:hypothetical protein LTR08_003089 [Meristemomyces frigidus]
MEDAPPVPPKDPAYAFNMAFGHERNTHSSGSKRKREDQDDAVYDMRNGRLGVVDPDVHTLKRSRSHPGPGETDTSDDAAASNQRSLRRKKKVGNLSSVNVRHAAEQASQEAISVDSRDSKFIEGSLTDKPSALPPSVFTRMIRTDSGHIQHIEALMEDYHQGPVTLGDPVEVAVSQEMALMSQRVDEITAESASSPKDDSAGFFRFGRSLAANFHPVSLWNKLWNETKEELTRHNMEEAERKRRQKEEAEARYAQMKQAGEFGMQVVGNHVRVSDDTGNPRDSGVVLDDASMSRGHHKTTSTATLLRPPSRNDGSSRLESEVPGTASKAKTLRGRFHFKRPSASDLKFGLKRVKSDINLAAPFDREPSLSLSPEKSDFEGSALKTSHSRYDLKKQNKLSKRVSNLESKLSLARQELNDALVDASPMPKLNNKYERFASLSTMKRSKFVPGRLQTLPSEQVLNPEQLDFGDDSDEESADKRSTERPRTALDIEYEDLSELNDDDTIKASRDRHYPARASSLFDPDKASTHSTSEQQQPTDNIDNHTSELTQLTSETTIMDPNSINNMTSDGVPESAPAGDYATLDAKLKALDANVKLAQKMSKPKPKKKARATEGDKPFNPGNETDDDEIEWAKATGTASKKRKSAGKNDGTSASKRAKGAAAKASSPPRSKTANRAVRNTSKTSPDAKQDGPKAEAEDQDEEYSDDEVTDAKATDELANSAPARNSVDSQGSPLESLVEEDEDVSASPMADEPSVPTATTTSTRQGRYSVRSRSRSGSPSKWSGIVRANAEEQLITRAAEAAQDSRGRPGSPPPVDGYSVVVEVVKETVSIIPGEHDVPMLPKAARGHFEAHEELAATAGADETVTEEKGEQAIEFEWPEDVF